jgi:hypothetical protein
MAFRDLPDEEERDPYGTFQLASEWEDYVEMDREDDGPGCLEYMGMVEFPGAEED